MQQLWPGQQLDAAGVRVPFTSATERAQLHVRAVMPQHDADAAKKRVPDGLADPRQSRHRAAPLVITAASTWATGAETTPRCTRAYRASSDHGVRTSIAGS